MTSELPDRFLGFILLYIILIEKVKDDRSRKKKKQSFQKSPIICIATYLLSFLKKQAPNVNSCTDLVFKMFLQLWESLIEFLSLKETLGFIYEWITTFFLGHITFDNPKLVKYARPVSLRKKVEHTCHFHKVSKSSHLSPFKSFPGTQTKNS